MNNYFNNMENVFDYGYKGTNFDISNDKARLVDKFRSQAGDNMTFNMANYNGDTTSDKLFDIYDGFIRGNMFPELYNQYKISKPFDIKPMNEQAELLTKIDAYCFATDELNLYLDTHPNDRNMINLFRELAEVSNRAVTEYENKYGPLLVDSSSTYPWAWNKSPWPWENI